MGIPVKFVKRILWGRSEQIWKPNTDAYRPAPKKNTKPLTTSLVWMSRQFRIFGDIYKASVYGTSAYVIRTPSLSLMCSLRTGRTT